MEFSCDRRTLRGTEAEKVHYASCLRVHSGRSILCVMYTRTCLRRLDTLHSASSTCLRRLNTLRDVGARDQCAAHVGARAGAGAGDEGGPAAVPRLGCA
jgi:hypothetical protein